MKKDRRSIVVEDEAGIESTSTGVEPLTTRSSFYADISGLLVKIGIRAAQNCAAYCLEDWIAPTPASVLKNTSAVPPVGDSVTPVLRPPRPVRVDRHRDKLVSAVLAGSSKE
jgi:hypothetical protein